MTSLVDLNLSPDTRTLRQFGVVALAGFGALSACAYFEALIFRFGLGEARVPIAVGLAGLGLLAAILGMVRPQANRVIYLGIALLAFPVGWVVSQLVLSLLFFAVIAPFGLVMRASGRDPMCRTWDASASSYWTARDAKRSAESYFRQF
ncbi:MAG: SxtJ family membrane protein [Myxococcales bacterium]|jgi:hypothetical protein